MCGGVGIVVAAGLGWCVGLLGGVCRGNLDVLVGRPRLRLLRAGGAKEWGWLADLVVSVESRGSIRRRVWLYMGVVMGGGGSGVGDSSR